MILFTLGYGMATLLMVILVPKILPQHLVPLGLGLHKSMEMASTVTSQTSAGLWLDSARLEEGETGRIRAGLLSSYWVISALQLSCAVIFLRFERRRRDESDDGIELSKAEEYEVLPMNTMDGEEEVDSEEVLRKPLSRAVLPSAGPTSALAKSDAERRRGTFFFLGSVGWIVVAWLIFLRTAWTRL